jgi:hypothetical protein
MRRAEVQLPDPLYEKVEGIARQLHLSVPEVLCKAIEQMVEYQTPKHQVNGDWRFPEAKHLGAFLAPLEDWRLLANEPAE